jgi:hypothetical protein
LLAGAQGHAHIGAVLTKSADDLTD